jgi:hypothetical protein
MSSDSTNTERQRRWRLRQTGDLPPVKRLICPGCDALCTDAHGGECFNCWRQTPEGKEWQRLRVADYRQRKRAKP